MRAELWRFGDTPFGVFGYLVLRDDGGEPIAAFATCEDDWRENALAVSCIPAGSYLCRRRQSPKFGNTFRVEDVPGRSQILFHAGNTEEDTKGCILLGEAFGGLTVADEDTPTNRPTFKWAVSSSRSAFRRFLSETAGLQEFPLSIRWSAPGEWRARVPFL